MSDIRTLTPIQAWQMIQEKPQTVMIDVRSSMEFLFIGHPKGAINVPWIDEPDWIINPNFTKQVRQILLGGASCNEEGCAPVVLICRSGKRSLEAAKKLVEDGLNEVYNIDGGFEGPLDEEHHRSTRAGWRFDGLPWEQC